VGRDLQREYGQPPQVIITNPILEGTDGIEKMSKSYNNHIALNDSPEEMYGKTMSIPDNLIEKYYLLAADSDETVMNKVRKELKNTNPRDLKRSLAKKIIEKYYDKSLSIKAEKQFDHIFIKKEIPDDIPKYSIRIETLLVEILLKQELVKSMTEGRRLIKQNAVKINGDICRDIHTKIKPGKVYTVKVGKRRFLKIG
jgi:tyrosyl-tRNA synthetase